MTPEEFNLTLQELGMSQAQLARHFELSSVTVNRWARGHTAIPGPAQRWLELALVVREATRAIPGWPGTKRRVPVSSSLGAVPRARLVPSGFSSTATTASS